MPHERWKLIGGSEVKGRIMRGADLGDLQQVILVGKKVSCSGGKELVE